MISFSEIGIYSVAMFQKSRMQQRSGFLLIHFSLTYSLLGI